MKKILLLIAIVLFGFVGQAQNDAKAQKILNKLSSKLNSYKNMYAEFNYMLVNKKSGLKQETKGKVSIQGDKFTASYMGITDIYDGKKLYRISPEDEEVYVSSNIDEESITPQKIFNFYKKGYIQKMDIKQKVNGRTIQYIKLIPKKNDPQIKSILLGIDIKNSHIFNVIILEKKGSEITIKLTKFLVNQVMAPKSFTFSKEKYSDYDIEELD